MAENTQGNVVVKINGKEVENTLRAIQREARVLRADLRNMTIGTDEYNRTARQLGATEQYLRRHTQALSNMANEGGRLRGLRNILSGVGQNLFGGTQIGSAIIGGAGPIGLLTAGVGGLFSIIRGGLGTMREFESALTALRVRTGITKEGVDELKTGAIELARAYGEAPAAIVKAFGEAASARPDLVGNTEALKQFTEQALILTKISGGELNDEIKNLSTIMNTNGIITEDAAKTVDILVGASQRGAKEVPFLAAAMEKIGGAAVSANVGLEEQAAVIEVLGEKMTSSAETAGTNVRNILITLQNEWSKSNEGPFNFGQALDQLQPSVNDITTLTKLFGKENAVAAQTLLQNRERIDELTTSIGSFQGSQGLANETLRTTDGQLSILSAKWDSMWASMTDEDGVITGIVGGLNMVIDAIGEAYNDVVRFFRTIFDNEALLRDEAAAQAQKTADGLIAKTRAIAQADLNDAKARLEKQKQVLTTLQEGTAEYQRALNTIEAMTNAIAEQEQVEAKREAARKQALVDAKNAHAANDQQQEAAAKKREQEQLAELKRQRDLIDYENDKIKLLKTRGLERGDFGDLLSDPLQEKSDQEIAAEKEATFRDGLAIQLELYKQHQKELTAAAEQEEKDRQMKTIAKAADMYEQIGSAAFDILGASIDKRTNRELNNLEEQKKKGIITEEEYEKRKEEIQKAAFIKKKRLDTAEALINGAVAITKTLATLGWPLGAASVIATGLQTAAQVAVIQAQEFGDGGMVEGPSHLMGGVPILAEGKEYIIRKRSVNPQTLPVLRAINETGAIPQINYARVNEGISISRGVSSPSPDNTREARPEGWTESMMEMFFQKLTKELNSKEVKFVQQHYDEFTERSETIKSKVNI